MIKKNNFKERFLKELSSNKGNIYLTCSRCNCSRTNVYKMRREDEEFNDKILEIKENAIDYVEDKLFKKIEEGELTAIIFFLKTQGKNRGYSERQEVAQVQEQPLFPDC